MQKPMPILRLQRTIGGQFVSHLQQQLFFDHFVNTSFIAETKNGELMGFVNGFFSQTELDTAYIHFAGVSPLARGKGVGRQLYDSFFDICKEHKKTTIKSITSKINTDSAKFHKSMGFSVDSEHPKKFDFVLTLKEPQ